MLRFAAAAVLVIAVSAGTWKEITTLDSIGLGIEFIDANTGFSEGDYNGEEGMFFLKTTDGGKTWNSSLVTDNFGIPLCIAVDNEGKNVLVGGLFEQYISHDGGKTFNETLGDHAQAQDCRFQNGDFYTIGAGLLWGSGVLVSRDHGTFFSGHNITNVPTGMYPEFVAAPSTTVYYATVGSSPQSDDDDAAVARSLRTKPTFESFFNVKEHGTFSGAIMKTVDGGVSWKVQITEASGTIDFAFIDCEDVNTCCATGGGATESVIVCTTDGNTWNNVWTNTTTQMTTITSLGNGNWVAAGTDANQATQSIHASILRSSDGGKTWTEDDLTALPQTGVIDASFPSISTGFLLGIDRFNSLILFGYTA